MSDTYLKIIPKHFDFIPEQTKQRLAVEMLENLAPDGKGVQAEVHKRVQFIDQGEYLEAIICPLCGSRLNIDYFSEDDPIRAWWDEAIIKADLTAGKGRFKFDDQCILEMPCCQGKAHFTSLRFHSPAGFARFELFILNPGIKDPLPE